MKQDVIVIDGKPYKAHQENHNGAVSLRLVPIESNNDRPYRLHAMKCAFNTWVKAQPTPRGAYKSATSPMTLPDIKSAAVKAIDALTRCEVEADNQIGRTYLSQEGLDQIVSFVVALQAVRVKSCAKTLPEWATWKDIAGVCVGLANDYNNRINQYLRKSNG